MKRIILLLVLLSGSLITFGSSRVFAAPTTPSSNDCQTNGSCVSTLKAGQLSIKAGDVKGLQKIDPNTFLVSTLNAVYSVTAVIAVIVMVVAGIMYVTSDGDQARTTRAKNAIIYSAVGLVIVGSAFIITGIIQYVGSN